MTTAYRGKRGFHDSPYHNCGRCGTKQKLSDLQWERGVLVCRTNDCVDTVLIGDRDADIVRAVKVDRKELQPDEKLIRHQVSDDEQIIF